MNKIKKILFLTFFLIVTYNLYADSIKIIAKVDNSIITNLDIKKEIEYLLFLNPKLKKLNKSKINKIAKDSLITEIIKKKEILKIYDLSKMENFLNSIEERFLKSKNINSKSDFIKILKTRNLDYNNIKNKLHIEALWSQLIYSKYSKNIKINEEELRKNILIQFKKKKKFEYNFSEILFTENLDESFEETFKRLKNSIKDIGFANTANIFSISSTSKNGGLIGWVIELQIS